MQCIQLEGAVWGHFQIDQNLFQGILVALRGDQDHRVGSFDILVEKSCTLFSGVELVSFNFGRSRLSHPPFHPRVVRRVMVEVLSTEIFTLYLTFVHFDILQI